MKLIAHRGNIFGSDLSKENNPEYIDKAIESGYDVEIDVRLEDKKFYLGHDESQYQVSISWLKQRKHFLWIHCKDLNSLEFFSKNKTNFNYFWHQEDNFTLTSKRYIWTYPGNPYTDNSVIVMPENTSSILELKKLKDLNCFGICSDYVGEIN